MFENLSDDELRVLEKALHDQCHSEYEHHEIARDLLGEVVDEELKRG